MKNVHRRDILKAVATTGAAALAGAALSAQPAGSKRAAPQKAKLNPGPPAPASTKAESYGPRELFAVVDHQGNLQRGLHVVSTKLLDIGVYQVIFARDIRRGVYIANAGGHGYVGIPLPASAAVIGLASDPRGVLVYMTDPSGDPVDTGFHLLVVCPEGYA
jgi:hypothetical protein